MKKKLPTYVFPISLPTINHYSFTTVVNLLLASQQATAHFCHIRVGLGEVRDEQEAELGAGLRKILAEMEAPPKKSKAKHARRKTARKQSKR